MSYITDARRLWPLIAQYVPDPIRPEGAAGPPWIPNEQVFMRLVHFLRAGCSWATFDELSRGSGVSGRTCRRRLSEWREAGVFAQVADVLRAQLPAPDIAHMDAMFVRARYSGDLVGLTRHGKGSKIQALVNSDSLPLAIQLESANPHESKTVAALLDLLEEMPATIVADRAYDIDSLRDDITERGSKLLSPHKKNRKTPPRDQEQIGRHYRQRWAVERLFAWLAPFRRLATRWEADALNFSTWLDLAVSLIYVRNGLWP